jgi:hypothetical protein
MNSFIRQLWGHELASDFDKGSVAVAVACAYKTMGAKKVKIPFGKVPLCAAWQHDNIMVGPRQRWSCGRFLLI